MRKKIILLSVFIIIGLGLCVFVFMQQASFGKLPTGERLERIKQSPNYVDGKFVNQNPKPQLTEGASVFSIYTDFIFLKKRNIQPTNKIPTVKTDIKSLNPNEDILLWLGHSSYFIQTNGKRILVDPVLSDTVSPVPFFIKAFAGSHLYTPEDFPEIDYIFITHDHWDHLSYESILALKDRAGKIVTALGVGEHLEHWGIPLSKIVETDWYDKVDLDEGFVLYTMPAHHFSGRGLKSNQTLWASYVLEAPNTRFYFGGDSAYGTHFKEIGKKFGHIDVAILENGQYDKRWKYVHMHPDEVLKAAQEINSDTLLPVHNGKFSLSYHAWDDPLKQISELNQAKEQRLITPMIGEVVKLKDRNQSFKKWWEDIN